MVFFLFTEKKNAPKYQPYDAGSADCGQPDTQSVQKRVVRQMIY